MGFDGVNSTLADVALPHLYEPTNTLRLITGLLSGIALAPVLLWLLNVVATPHTPGSQAVVQSGWEIVLLLAVAALFAALVLDGSEIFYLPVALISVAGIASTLMVAVLLVIVKLGGLAGRVVWPRQLVAPAALALLVTCALLGVLAMLRWSITGTPS